MESNEVAVSMTVHKRSGRAITNDQIIRLLCTIGGDVAWIRRHLEAKLDAPKPAFPSALLLKVFEVSEEEWVAAWTAKEAVAWCSQSYSPAGRELSEAELIEKGLIFSDGPRELSRVDLESLPSTSEDGRSMTFLDHLKQLIAEGGPFPTHFASGNS